MTFIGSIIACSSLQFFQAQGRELLGLTWADVDFKAGQIHINRTFNSGAKPHLKTEEAGGGLFAVS